MKSRREPIMTALFDLLSAARFSQPVQGATEFVTKSRRVRLWTEVDANQKPALFMADHTESPSYTSGNLAQKNTLSVELYIYCDSGKDAAAVPSIDINIIADAIDAQLNPLPHEQGRKTLGGLVEHVRIEGQVLKVPGDEDGEGLLLIPLKIFTT